MNEYIRSQIINMNAILQTFEQSCKMAATKNDGQIDKDEAKQLKKISAACQKFKNDLNKIK